MKILNAPGSNNTDTLNWATERAIEELGIAEKDLTPDVKDWYTVRKIVSDIMTPLVKGRVTPVRGSLPTPSKEAKQLLRTHVFSGILYPRRITKDSQKKKYLKNAVKKGDITKEIYLDLKSVLK